MSYFVTAIGTDSGKTLVSALLCCALDYAYWKPVQCGSDADSPKVKSLAQCEVFPEAYYLQTPESPHAAAAKENIRIELTAISLPRKHQLIVEGAGGVMVPLNEKDTMLDLMQQLALPVILVSNTYLGSINHTLLTVEVLKKSGLEIVGIVFNGEYNKDTENVILQKTGLKKLFHLPYLAIVNEAVFSEMAASIKEIFNGENRQ